MLHEYIWIHTSTYCGGESGYRLLTCDRVSLKESKSKPGGKSSMQVDLSSPTEPP